MTDYTIEEFCDKHNACESGREWALSNCQTMQEAWDKCSNGDLIWIATREGVLTDKELRLFAIFCARQNQHLLTDDRSMYVIDVCERHANGNATDEDLAAASAAAWDAAWDAASAAAAAAAGAAARDAAWAAAWAAARDAAGAAAWDAARAAARAAARDAAWAAARDAAGAAAWDAAGDAAGAAAWDAARAAARAAARDAAWAAQSSYLRENTKPNFSKP